jgi:hypothetical protein
VRLPVPGRETKRPGAARRRRRRAADPHAGSDFQQAFPRGYWGFLQHPATSLFSTCLGLEAVWPGGSAHSLLGRPPGAAQVPGSEFFLEISFGRCSFPHFGCRFLRAHKLLIDPEGHALLDSTGRRLAGQLLRRPPTATVVVGFVQPYKPTVESSSSSAHTAGAASAGPVSAAGEWAASAVADVKLPSGLSAAALSAAKPAGKQNPAQMKAAYSRLLDEFPAVVCASKRLPPVSLDVVHHIVTHGPPITSKFRKLDGEKLAAVKAEFKQLEEDDIIQRSTSSWSSPLHMVRKADGSLGPCEDFQRLNLVTKPDVYPLPNMLDFATKAGAAPSSPRST